MRISILNGALAIAAAALLGGAVGCNGGGGGGDDTATSAPEQQRPSFEEFVATVYREPATGIYIVDGDEPVLSVEGLRPYYERLYGGDALTVHQAGGVDQVWNATQKLNISYCVSNTFGDRKQRVVEAMATATGGWMAAANVRFVYAPEQDANCTASNAAVVFDVNPTSGGQFVARAFFPGQPRSSSNVLIDDSAFEVDDGSVFTLDGVLKHELGHALGFRHEHVRASPFTIPFENWLSCLLEGFIDTNYRPVTAYDAASVMHYPQCGGTGDLSITQLDVQGAQSIYGPPQP
jgi:serine protease